MLSDLYRRVAKMGREVPIDLAQECAHGVVLVWLGLGGSFRDRD